LLSYLNLGKNSQLLKEIRSFDRENNAELIEAQRVRKDEVLAAWKLRYYIEYLRLVSLRHVVMVVEGKNIELEEECGLLQQTSAVAEIENESLTNEIARLQAALAAVQDERKRLHDQLQDTQFKLEVAERQVKSGEAATAQSRELIQLSKQALGQESGRVAVLQSELDITRLTCQELVRTSAKKDSDLQDMGAELVQLRALHKAEQAEILIAREVHLQELEHAKMREEDNEIRYRKANDLHAVLNEREKTIRHYEVDIAAMRKEVAGLKDELQSASGATKVEKDAVAVLEQEKTGLQKLLSELARRLTQADEEAIKHSVVERQHKADAKTSQNIINEHLGTIEELEEQAAAAQSEIEFLVEENHELAREIECHHMYGEEMMTRYLHTFSSAERNLEYSRFLEEELFCARKLYEKNASDYVDTGGKSRSKAGPEVFGDVSEESYGYRGANAGDGGGEEGVPGGPERSKSFIESWTGLEPVAPIVVHLNSFSKGARSSSKNRNEFDRPNSATMYNPDSRPNSTGGAPNNSMVAEQRLLMVLAKLEEKMKSVDRAADSLRFLAEKADAIEKVQSTTANIINSHNTAAAIARQPVRLSEQNAKTAEKKQALIDKHINMERVFSEMHSSLDQVNAQLAAQQEEIAALQDRRAECKNIISGMKKLIKKSRKASTKDPNAVLLTEAEEGRTETEMSLLSEEMEGLKDRINVCKADNLDLNSKSIALQTELYHLDQDLEKSSGEFFELYAEHITAYYPAELAHLIENADGQVEEHGKYALPAAGTSMPLNTLYEEDEWAESTQLTPSRFGTIAEGSQESGGESFDSPVPGNSQEFATGDGSSLEETSESDAQYDSYNGDSPSFSSKASKKHKRSSKSESGGSEKSRKSSKMGKLARKVSKMQKAAKKFRKESSLASSLETGSEAEGSVHDVFAVGTGLEEGSSGLLEEVPLGGSHANSLQALVNPERAVFDPPAQPPGQSQQQQAGLQQVMPVHTSNPYTFHGPGAPLSPTASLRWDSQGSSPSPSRVGRGVSADSQVDRAARLQIQQARERLAQLRTDLERNIASLDAMLDEVEILENTRTEIRNEIVRWVNHFYALCGYYPDRGDKLRSTTLKPALDDYFATQANLQEMHSRAVSFYEQAHNLRATLIEEQHQHHSAQPIEALDEQMRMLYPISDFGDLVLEDPLQIPADWEIQAAQQEGAGGAVHMQAYDDGGSVQFASQADSDAYFLAQDLEGSLSLSALRESKKEPDDYPATTMLTAESSIAEGAPATTAATAGRRSVESSVEEAPRAGVEEEVQEVPEEVVEEVVEEVERADMVGSEETGADRRATRNERYEQAVAEELQDWQQASVEEGEVPSAVTAMQQPVVGEVPSTPFPVTPFTNAVATLAAGDLSSIETWSEMSLKMTKSIKLDGLFASGDESPEALLAENKKLRKELRVWTADYQRLYGHKPNPADFDSFDEIIKAKLFRKNQISVLLEVAMRAGKVTAEAMEGMSVKAPAPTAAQQDALPARDEADYTYSVPTTPYHANFGDLDGDQDSSQADFSMRFSKSTKWAGMFADSAEETTEALLAESKRIKQSLRDWSQQYEQTHGSRPNPEQFATFDPEVQQLIYRKHQLKELLAGRTDATQQSAKLKRGASKQSKPSSKGKAESGDESVGSKSAKRNPGSPRNARGARSASPERAASANSSAQSFPTTPYADRFGGLDGGPGSPSDFSMRFSKSSKWAALYADPLDESPEALLAEQRELRGKLRAWAQTFLSAHGRKPLPEEYETFDEEVKRMIFRKNQLKMHFAQLETEGGNAGFGAEESENSSLVSASPRKERSARSKSPAASRSKRPTSEESDPSHVSLPTTPFGTGSQLENEEASTEELLREQSELRTEIRIWTAEYVKIHGQKPNVDSFASFEPEIKAKLLRKNQIKKLLAERSGVLAAGSVREGESFEIGSLTSDTSQARSPIKEKSRRAKGLTSGDAALGDALSPVEESPQKTQQAEPSKPKAKQVEAPEQQVALPAAETTTPKPESARKQKARSSRTKADAPPEEAAERVSTALSTSSAYSVPTTPFADHLRGAEVSGISDTASAFSADASVRIAPSAQWEKDRLNLANTARSIAESIEETPEQLAEELKKLKRDLRKWNNEFMKTNGRNPGAEDFDSFDENIKSMLFRKNQVKEKLDSLQNGSLASAASVADSSTMNEAHPDGLQWPAPTEGAYVEGKEQEESAERRHREGGRSKKAKTSDAPAVEVAHKPTRAAPAAAATPATAPQSTEDMVAEAANELNAIKQTLRLWQKEFFELNGREPQRLDLTPDVLAMGERRDALKQILIQHDRADLASSKSSKNTPPKSAQRPTVGLSPSANSSVAEAAAPTSQTPANPTPAIVSTPTPAEAGAVRSDRATSSKSKRVSFIARGSAAEQDGGSASEAEAPAQPKQIAAPVAVAAPAPTPAAAASPTKKPAKATAPVPASAPIAVVAEPPAAASPAAEQTQQLSAEELGKEYSRVKKALKSKQKAFFEEHGREPGDEDFDALDEEFKELVVRKYELKAILGEMGDEAAAASTKVKKSKKSSKASKHGADSSFD
jgi:chromosome segregation ATPase